MWAWTTKWCGGPRLIILRMAALSADMKDNSDAGVKADRIRQFADALRQHIRWEEETLFEATQRLMKRAELKALGRELDERLPLLLYSCAVRLSRPTGDGFRV
jgi:hemerythrin-like domain-containing protein